MFFFCVLCSVVVVRMICVGGGVLYFLQSPPIYSTNLADKEGSELRTSQTMRTIDRIEM
jgi:hypothetical protein